MSLVNDMLRDLDARRREAPTRGLGSEKLVPATEAAAQRSRRRALIIGFTALCVLVVVVVFFLWPDRGGRTGSLDAVRITTDAGSGTTVHTEAPTTPAPDVSQRQGSESDTDALTELAERLARLEQQNQALREQASQQATGQVDTPPSRSDRFEQQDAAAAWQPTDWTTPSDGQSVPTSSAARTDNNSVSGSNQSAETQLAVEAPQMTNADAVTPQESTGSSSRSPRELSFEDRDRQQVQLALEQWSSGQQLTALRTLDSFTYENAEAHRSRETLAKLLLQQGETERALQVAEVGLVIAPRFAGYRKIKARALLGQGAAEEALGILSGNAPSVNADAEYHDLLATAYLSAQRYDSAVISYRMLLQQDESVGRWWYGMGTAFEGQGRVGDAISAYDRALRSGGLSVTLRQNSQQRLQALRQTSGIN